MVKAARETPVEHDRLGGQPAAKAGDIQGLALLPTPTTPGYTYFTDYLGHRWTCCVCMNQYLIYLQKRWIKLGWIKSGIDIWQLTGDASASAGTHSQGGVGDILYETDDRFVLYLRDHGATASWRRTTAQGFTKQHVHFVLRGCPHLPTAAKTQVTEEQNGPPSGTSSAGYHGGDGLTGTAFDYHRDPQPYMNWDAGLNLIKKELGLLALNTTTVIMSLTPNPLGKGGWASTTARTSQPGTTYAQGTHIYEFLPAGTTTWTEFKRLPVVNGASQFYWNYGGPQPIRARFVPKDVTVSAPSVSAPVSPVVVDIPPLQVQVQMLTASNATLTAANADLQAKLDACLSNPPSPPEPVPAYGVDVSGWQTVEQVQALVADPKNAFVIIKSTEGKSFKADTFQEQLAASGDKFLGPYHYTGTPGNTVQEEADWFLGYVGEAIYRNHVSFLDIETAVTPTFVLGWLDYVKAQTGIAPVWYTNWKWLQDDPKTGFIGLRTACTIEQWERLCDYGLWLADVKPPGQFSPVSPRTGSTKAPTIVLHQYAYTPLGDNEIDRDWTPDLNVLRAS